MTSPAPAATRLPWYERAGGEVWAHTQRAFYPPHFAFPQHRHHYAEFFLIERGSGVHRVADQVTPLHAGDVVFVHPEVVHGLEASSQRALVFLNVAIPLRLYRDLDSRFGSSAQWLWSAQPPRTTTLSARDLGVLAPRLGELEANQDCRDRLQVESVVLETMWHASAAVAQRPRLPAQLSQAIRDLSDPENLRLGVAGMAARAGWSREHLNRQIRKHFHETSVALLTRHRLDHAARLLRHGDRQILAVCQECGLDNLSHFYRLVRRRFGCSPGALRGRAAGGAV